jgi:carbamoyltransferase
VATAFLGLNILHDTSAAIVVDGELVAAVEEERFNRDRHTRAFPVSATEYCLERAGIRREDLQGVAVTFDYREFRRNHAPFEQDIVNHDDLEPLGRERIAEQNAATWRRARDELAKNGFSDARFLRHHLTHAACGYYLSGFDEAGVLVIDGRGERESTTLWHGHGPDIDNLESYGVENSLGHLYTYVTSLCGLYGKIGNEGKTMGLAGYGTGKIRFDQVVTYSADKYLLHRDRMREFSHYRVPLGKPDENSRELAHGVQAKLEEVYHFLAARLERLTGCRQLVIAGGVALNCNANGALAASSTVDQLFIPPAANDAGTSVGAAFLQWVAHSGKAPAVPADMVYLGPDFSEAAVADAIKSSGITRFARVEDPAVVAATAIANGLVVGWCQGRMEFGPRALGARSILADPRDPGMPDKLNARVKFREPWRPFAPSVLAEESAAWFEPPLESPYMLLSLAVRPERRALVPAITHVDGSARVQAVTQEANPLYYRLIDSFREATGIPMVLNTSLNIRGEPIARTPADATRCFTDSGLDVLVIADFVMWKDGVPGELVADRSAP